MADINHMTDPPSTHAHIESPASDEIPLLISLKAARVSLEQCNKLAVFQDSWTKSYETTTKRMNMRSDSSTGRRASVGDQSDLDYLHEEWEKAKQEKVVAGAVGVLRGATTKLARQAKLRLLVGTAANQEKNLAWTDVEIAADECAALAAEIERLIHGGGR